MTHDEIQTVLDEWAKVMGDVMAETLNPIFDVAWCLTRSHLREGEERLIKQLAKKGLLPEPKKKEIV